LEKNNAAGEIAAIQAATQPAQALPHHFGNIGGSGGSKDNEEEEEEEEEEEITRLKINR
jgi:hypothetical protein